MKSTLEMAREAGFKEHNGMIYVTTINDDCAKELERFAELVRADERNSWPAEMEAMERQVNILTDALAQEREACGRVRASKPRELNPVGTGMLLGEQQFCFDKGWREGAASVRAAIRARSNK